MLNTNTHTSVSHSVGSSEPFFSAFIRLYSVTDGGELTFLLTCGLNNEELQTDTQTPRSDDHSVSFCTRVNRRVICLI